MTDSTAAGAPERRAVIDLGSNTFRLVVFSALPGRWWRQTDEIFESVRIGEGAGESGKLREKPMARALSAIEAFAHFCRATELGPEAISTVATSAIREASNRDEFLERVHDATGLDARVLSREEEARYGYLAAVNSTSLRDGTVLDLGGGSLQLVGVRDRRAQQLASWPLGTVRMTERFLPDRKASRKQLEALRKHVREELASAPWLGRAAPRLVGIGGTVRNLATAAQAIADLPDIGVQGFALERKALTELVAELASRSARERQAIPGIKAARADVILAGAATIEAVLEAGGFDAVEATEAGLREGVFFEAHLAQRDPPLFASVRESSARNLAALYGADLVHAEHVARLALAMFDELATAGLHKGDPAERELLWTAAIVHDVGMAVDYDDHHKHSRYLILNAGLPGFTPRELALVAQAARYHRKGAPSLDDLTPYGRKGDGDRLNRIAALLRVAEQLERSRDQAVRAARVGVQDGRVRLELVADEDVTIARWAAGRQGDVFERAFGRELEVR